MTVVLLAMAAATIASAQTPAPLQAKLAVRPVTRGDIAAFKLPSTTQVSAGLKTVGLGQPLYLEAQINSAIAAADVAICAPITDDRELQRSIREIVTTII